MEPAAKPAIAAVQVTADPNPGGLSEAEARRADVVWAGSLTALLLALFAVLHWLPTAAVPVLVGLAGAYALDPVADALEKRRLSRTLAVALIFLVIGLAAAGALLYLVPALGHEIAKLPDFFRDIAHKAIPRVETAVGHPLPADVKSAVESLSQQSGGLAEKVLPSIAGFAMGALSSTASALVFVFGMLVIPVITFHLLRDYDRIVESFRTLLPRRYEALVSRRFGEVNAVLGGFIRGQLTVGAILTGVYGVGLSVAGLDLAVVIGAVAGFGTMIPYVGPGVGMALAALSLMVSWQGAWQLAVVAATFAVGMTAEGLYITPRVVGGKVGLSAVLVMIAILVFGNLFGFAGVLLAVPVSAALKVVSAVVLFRYRRSKVYLGPDAGTGTGAP
ncbi:MAG TPA: AI-2E family transporter [Myxococcales bacterium]